MVETSSGKLRLVLNLQYPNQFLYAPHFKYEDLRVAALLFEKHKFFFKFDVRSGYHHVDINPEHQKYFRGSDGVTGYYMFTVLPFVLSTACYIFTKLMRALVKYWRSRGLKAIVYLHDGIIAVEQESKAVSESSQVQHDLQYAGFVINVEKSVWDPKQKIEWLGLVIDLAKGEFSVPDRKLVKLRSQSQEALGLQLMPARKLVSLIGKIVSTATLILALA